MHIPRGVLQVCVCDELPPIDQLVPGTTSACINSFIAVIFSHEHTEASGPFYWHGSILIPVEISISINNIKCGMELRIFSQTFAVAPLTYWEMDK